MFLTHLSPAGFPALIPGAEGGFIDLGVAVELLFGGEIVGFAARYGTLQDSTEHMHLLVQPDVGVLADGTAPWPGSPDGGFGWGGLSKMTFRIFTESLDDEAAYTNALNAWIAKRKLAGKPRITRTAKWSNDPADAPAPLTKGRKAFYFRDNGWFSTNDFSFWRATKRDADGLIPVAAWMEKVEDDPLSDIKSMAGHGYREQNDNAAAVDFADWRDSNSPNARRVYVYGRLGFGRA